MTKKKSLSKRVDKFIGKNPSKRPTTYQWWTKEDPHIEVFSVVNQMNEAHKSRQVQYMLDAWLYQAQDMLSFQPGSFDLLTRGWADQQLKFNIIKSSIDTLCSKVGKNNPMVYFLTKKGDFFQQTRAKQLTQFLWGLFDAANVYKTSQMVFRDACVFGTGIFHYYPEFETKTICVERVIPEEILIDEWEALHGQPRQLHRRKYVGKETLKDMFPDKADEIEANASYSVPSSVGSDVQSKIGESCLVVESWYLGKNGKHSINMATLNLLDEDYDKDYFPFVFFKWDEPLDGFYGLGCVNVLQPIQFEITQTIQSIQLALYYFAVPRTIVNTASMVNIGHLHNTIDGSVIEYSGDPAMQPELWSPGQIMSGEVYRWVDNLIEKGFNVIGVSQLDATSQKPGGLDSGEALRTYSDISSQRFVTTGQRWEACFVELGKRLIDVAKDMYGKETDLGVNVPGAKFLRTIQWSKVSLDADMFTIQAFPTALLAQDPAGKQQQAQELVQAGLVPPEMVLSILQLPDTDGLITLQQSSIDLAMHQIDLILQQGKVPELNDNQDMTITLKLAAQMSVSVELDDTVDEDYKELLKDWINDLKEKLAPPPAPIAPMGAPAMPGGSPAMGLPAKPPVSNLLPQQA